MVGGNQVTQPGVPRTGAPIRGFSLESSSSSPLKVVPGAVKKSEPMAFPMCGRGMSYIEGAAQRSYFDDRDINYGPCGNPATPCRPWPTLAGELAQVKANVQLRKTVSFKKPPRVARAKELRLELRYGQLEFYSPKTGNNCDARFMNESCPAQGKYACGEICCDSGQVCDQGKCISKLQLFSAE